MRPVKRVLGRRVLVKVTRRREDEVSWEAHVSGQDTRLEWETGRTFLPALNETLLPLQKARLGWHDCAVVAPRVVERGDVRLNSGRRKELVKGLKVRPLGLRANSVGLMNIDPTWDVRRERSLWPWSRWRNMTRGRPPGVTACEAKGIKSWNSI